MPQYRDVDEIRRSHEELKGKYSQKKSSWAARDTGIFDYIKKHFNQDCRILDIGCANGFFANKLLKNGYKNIDLVDVDDYLIFDEVINLGCLKLVDLNFEKLPCPEKYFDLITAFQILEHLENPFHLMRECSRVLKPGGILLLSIPNIFTLKSRLMFLFSGNFPSYNLKNDHISLLTKDVFEKCFLKDFEMEKTKFFLPISRLANLKRLFESLFEVKVCYVLRRK